MAYKIDPDKDELLSSFGYQIFGFYPSMANIVPVADQEVNAAIRAGQYSPTITEANYAPIGYNLKFSYTLLDHPDILQPVWRKAFVNNQLHIKYRNIK